MTADHDARMLAGLLHDLAPHGVGAERITVAWQDDWQDYDVLIDGGELTDQQIAAVRAAVRMGGCVRFGDGRNTDRWLEILRREGRELQLARAAELRQLHPDIPKFNPSTGALADFARSLEIWCGFEPGSAFAVTGEKTVMVEFRDGPPALLSLTRLMDATAIFAEEGIDVLILGGSER